MILVLPSHACEDSACECYNYPCDRGSQCVCYRGRKPEVNVDQLSLDDLCPQPAEGEPRYILAR